MSLLDALSQGFRGAAGILSPDVQQQTFAQDERLAQQEQQQKMLLLKHMQQQVQSGAADPNAFKQLAQRMGVPTELIGGPGVDAQVKMQAMAKDKRIQAAQEAITSNPQWRAAFSSDDPDPAKRAVLRKQAMALFPMSGIPMPEYLKGFNPDVKFGPAGSLPFIDGVPGERIPDKANDPEAVRLFNALREAEGRGDTAAVKHIKTEISRKQGGHGYKERNVSYDGNTQIKESSNDGGITWAAIPGAKPVDIRKMSGGADVSVRVDTGNPTGVVDKSDTRNVVQRVRGAEALIQEMSAFLRDVETTPGATGIRGSIGQPAAGVAEQIFPGLNVSNAVSKAITGASPEAVAQLRVRAQMLVAKLLPVVTNETGRFTASEREIATTAQGALAISQGPTQVKAASRALIMLAAADRERGLKDLGQPPKHDLNSETGRLAQAREFKVLGLSDADAVKATRLLKTVRE